jgi:hypothetical protein
MQYFYKILNNNFDIRYIEYYINKLYNIKNIEILWFILR